MYVVDSVPSRTPSFVKSGMSASVSFVIQEKRNVLWLPLEAVKESGGSYWVNVANGEDIEQVRRQSVQTGLRDGKRVEMVFGLHEGDRVIVNSIAISLKSNRKVNPFMPQFQRQSGSQQRR